MSMFEERKQLEGIEIIRLIEGFFDIDGVEVSVQFRKIILNAIGIYPRII